MKVFKQLCGHLSGIVISFVTLLLLLDDATSASLTSDEWSLLTRSGSSLLGDYEFNGSSLASDVSLLPNANEPTLAPSDELIRYEPTKRICEDLFPPKDNTTMSDATGKFDYEVIADWYSQWHLTIAVESKVGDVEAFKGLIIQVRHKGVVVGTYDEAPEYSFIDCPPGKQNTPYYSATHEALFKFVTWKPPKDFDSKSTYVIHTSVIVKNGEIYRKKTNIPLWETLPKDYNISDPNLNSENFKVTKIPWDLDTIFKPYETYNSN